MSREERDLLLDQLLDYVFGCAEDSAAIEARIEAEPEVRALLEEARGMAKVLSEAAKGDAPAMQFEEPREPASVGVEAVADQAPGSRTSAGPTSTKANERPSRAGFQRFMRIAASIVFMVCLAGPTGWWGIQSFRAKSAVEDSLRLVLSGPASVVAGTDAQLRVETWDMAGEPATSRIHWRALDADGLELEAGEGESDGTFDLNVSASLAGLQSIEVRAEKGPLARRASLSLSPQQHAPLAHLSSDKPAYQPGETVWMRALLLDRSSMQARKGNCNLRLVDAKDTMVDEWTLPLEDGVAAPNWEIPKDAAGGLYHLELRDAENKFAFESLPLTVRRYQPPTLEKRIELGRETYAPGEEGSAEVVVARVAGGIPVGAQVRGSLVIDGDEVWSETKALDADGHVIFGFRIPQEVDRGDARLFARIADGGVVETAVEAFIVPTGRVEVSFYPEGGDIAVGQRTRIYADVSDALGRPISAIGNIIDGSGDVVARFATQHQGRARFEIDARQAGQYKLVLEEPTQQSFALPRPKVLGIALRTRAGTIDAGAPIEVEVSTPDSGPWIATVFCRGLLVAQDSFTGAGKHELSMTPSADAAGVLRVTIFDHMLEPVAERLVHRTTTRAVHISLKPRSVSLLPGAHQVVDVLTSDENGLAIPAVIGLAVSDRAVREMVGERRIGLADQSWLVADVEELEDAREFFHADDMPAEEVDRNIDLLLGTQGWRRFAWVEPAQLIDREGDRGRRLLARMGLVDRPNVIDEAGDSAVTAVMMRRASQTAKRNARDFAGLGGFLLLCLIGIRIATHLPVLRELAPWKPALLLSAAGVAALIMLQNAGMRGALPLPMAERMFAAADGMAVRDQFLVGAIEAEEAPEAPGMWHALGYGGGGDIVEDEIFLGRTGAAAGREGVDVAGFLADAPEEVMEEPAAEGREILRALGYAAEGDDDDFRWRNGRGGRVPVRVYSHQNAKGGRGLRTDFTETVYWNALLRTDELGRAQVGFDLSDRVTTWVIEADAHGAGRVGQQSASFEAVPPFHLNASLPIELTVGDQIQLPIALACSDESLRNAQLDVQVAGPLALMGEAQYKVMLDGGRGRVLVPILVEAGDGSDAAARIALTGKVGGFSDGVGRELRVVPRGYPIQRSWSGELSDLAELELSLPEEWVPGSLALRMTFYPSPLSDVLEGLDGMLREPYGCFEQASSVNYPNIMCLAYLEAAGVEMPAVAAKARGLLERGYAKIAGYECGQRGYEWFGSDPGHEALTAYGLLEFADMAAVYAVDDDMVGRTRSWLLGRRNGSGGFERNAQALDSFGSAPQEVTDTYCTYALVVSGTPVADIEAELKRLEARALTSEDAYEVAVAACGLNEAGRDQVADSARERLKEMQKADGRLVGSTSTITASRGTDLVIETSSFAALAWMQDAEDLVYAERALTFVIENRSGRGTFGATQATIMALKALTEHAHIARRVANPGSILVSIDGQQVSKVSFDAGRNGAIEITDLENFVAPGPNLMRMEMVGENRFPYAVELSYYSEFPADDSQAPLMIRTTFDTSGSAQGAMAAGAAARVVEGESIAMVIEVENPSSAGVPMSMAIVGIPAGLEIRSELLEDLKKAGRFDLWEIRGRELILYWRDMAPGTIETVTLDLIARIPGTTTGPASRAYLYYQPGAKRWCEPLQVKVSALEQR